MFSKVKNALYSVVNGLDTIPSIADGETRTDEKAPKYPYTRPHFLLFQKDEVQVSADHQIRPIIVPRDITKLPWHSGYAETVNAGKSEWNEDQACVWKNVLVRDTERHIPQAGMPYTYFALFDGHAGHGAAVAAANQLHEILHAKLLEVLDYIHPPVLDQGKSSSTWNKEGFMWFPGVLLTRDDFIIGALESAFNKMDEVIGEDKKKYTMSGGCTALVALFISGKLYVANAGDSRGVRCKDGIAYPMSNDFTPSTEKTRLQQLAACKPELLMNHFTHLEYTQRLVHSDVGRRIIYRNAYMAGWAYKTCSLEDLRVPVVSGEGKRSRLLATIGVTRGLGDHELCSIINKTPIKPFLSSQAEVQMFDIDSSADLTENDVLVMGTDGLWDVTNNEKTASIVENSLSHFPRTDDTRFKYRYISAAQDLVMHSRGKPSGRSWQTSEGSPATIDDISVFVIPLLPYQKEHAEWLNQYYDELYRQHILQDVHTDTSSPSTESVSAQNSSVVPTAQPPATVTVTYSSTGSATVSASVSTTVSTTTSSRTYSSIIVPTRASTIAPPTVCSVPPTPAAAPLNVIANSSPPVTTSANPNAMSSPSEVSAAKLSSPGVPATSLDKSTRHSANDQAQSRSVSGSTSATLYLSSQLPVTQSAFSTSTVSSPVLTGDVNVELLKKEIELNLKIENPVSTLVDDKRPKETVPPGGIMPDLVDVQLSVGSQSPMEFSDSSDSDDSAPTNMPAN